MNHSLERISRKDLEEIGDSANTVRHGCCFENGKRVFPWGMTPGEKKKYVTKYRWSSFSGYISPGKRRGFLQVEEVLAHFGGDKAAGRKAYENFVMEGLSREITNPLERGKGHGIVGVSTFIEKIKARYIGFTAESREVPAVKKIVALVEPERIVRGVCEEFKAKREELLKKGYKGVARGVLMEMLYRYGGKNQREIGEMMGIDYSAVSVMRKRLSALQEKDRKLSAKIDKLKKQLWQSQE